MSDNFEQGPGEGEAAPSEAEQAVDELGRRFGAELRRPAPAGGADSVVRHVRTRRVVTGAVAAAGAAVLVVVAMAVLGDDDSDRLEPATPATSTTAVDTTTVDTAAAPVTNPSTTTTSTPSPAPVTTMSLGYRYAPPSLWTGTTQIKEGVGFLSHAITELDPETLEPVSERVVTAQALDAAAPFAIAYVPSLVAVAGRTIVLSRYDRLMAIDFDTGEITPIEGADALDTSIGAVGDTVMIVDGNTLSRLNLDSGAVEPLGTIELGTDPGLFFTPDALWLYGRDRDGPSPLWRVDPDGSIHRLDQLSGVIGFGFWPGPGLVWMVVNEPAEMSGSSGDLSTAELIGVDRNDGHTVVAVSVPPEPPQSAQLVAFRDGLFASTVYGDTLQWRWFGNDGTTTELAPRPELTPVEAAGERLILRTEADELVTIAVSDLLAGS